MAGIVQVCFCTVSLRIIIIYIYTIRELYIRLNWFKCKSRIAVFTSWNTFFMLSVSVAQVLCENIERFPLLFCRKNKSLIKSNALSGSFSGPGMSDHNSLLGFHWSFSYLCILESAFWGLSDLSSLKTNHVCWGTL